MRRSGGTTWRRSGAWVTGFVTPRPDNCMPIRWRLAIAFAAAAAAAFALGSWLCISGFPPAQVGVLAPPPALQLSGAGASLNGGGQPGAPAAAASSAPGEY